MKSVSICHAAEDRGPASDLARFIEVNFASEVSLDDAVVTRDCDVLEAAERALSANLTLVLFSPASLPAPLKRDRWEKVFLHDPGEYGTHLAFVLLAECAFPALLRRKAFFDCSRDFLAGARLLKRWMMSLDRTARFEPAVQVEFSVNRRDVEQLWTRVVDRPGCADDVDATVARQLAHEAREDFEAVFWFPCLDWPLALILGELGQALGLALSGPVKENRRKLLEHCAERRYLFLFEGAAHNFRGPLRFSGRTSVLFVEPAGLPVRAPAADVTIANIADAIADALELLPADPGAGEKLAKRIVKTLSDYSRYAEADLVLQAMQDAGCPDENWIRRERAWIEERWFGEMVLPPEPLAGRQLPLFGDR